MSESLPDVVVLDQRIEPAVLRRLVERCTFINIRPSAGNRGMELQDEALRARVREITSALVGEGEPL